MTDTSTPPPPPASADDFEPDAPTDDDSQGNPGDGSLGDAGKQAIDRMKVERADALKQMKALREELDTFKKASLNDSERAVLDAEARGRNSAMAEVGVRLARASFDAMAARRNPAVDTDSIVEYVDMAKFLDEHGEVNKRSLQAAVDRLVPEAEAGPPSFDGGARTTSQTRNMNDIIRDQALGGRSA